MSLLPGSQACKTAYCGFFLIHIRNSKFLITQVLFYTSTAPPLTYQSGDKAVERSYTCIINERSLSVNTEKSLQLCKDLKLSTQHLLLNARDGERLHSQVRVIKDIFDKSVKGVFPSNELFFAHHTVVYLLTHHVLTRFHKRLKSL